MLCNVCEVYLRHKTWAWLGWEGSNLIYDGVEMSRISSIYDSLYKDVTELICDA
jgi:hypothetical protein